MTKQEKLIRSIKDSFDKEKNTKSYERVKRMAKTLSNNLYSEESHFIYELIQNAQDNDYDKNVEPSLDFYIFKDGILTKNNEIGFSETNIRSLCDFSDSTKSKNKELGFIGEKGIGFKSVFAITDKPSIYSNGYKFYFKEGEYIEPYWIENFDTYPKEFSDLKTTNIYLPYSLKFENQSDIERKLDDIEPILILFLNKLKTINIFNENKLQFSVKKEKLPNDIIAIKSDNKELSFKIFNKIIDCPSDLKEEKREQVTRREIFLSFPLQKINDTRVFSFLPTEIETGLSFLIQGDFLLNASRSEIERNKQWNLWILDEIVNFFVDIFFELQTIDKFNYLDYLEPDKSSNKFIDNYYQKILTLLEEKELFLDVNNDFNLSSNILILDEFDFMYDYFKDLDNINFNNLEYKILNQNFYIPKHLIKRWNIKVIKKNDFLKIISQNKEHFSNLFKQESYLFEKLIEFIGNNFKDTSILKSLPIIPIDIDGATNFFDKNELTEFKIFFYLDDDGILNEVFRNLKIVSKSYKEKLQKIDFYINSLDISRPEIIDIINSLDNDFFTNIKNNVNFLIFIKDNYKNDEINILKSLIQKYRYITHDNYLISHSINDYADEFEHSINLYISKDYLDNKNCVENIVLKYCHEEGKNNISFISSEYITQDHKLSKKDINVLKNEWSEFLEKLKINDNLKFVSEKLEMWAIDSSYNRRSTSTYIKNIPFIGSALFNLYDKDKEFKSNINLANLAKDDSIFLFRKLTKLNINNISYYVDNQLSYRKVIDFYREFKYSRVSTPWKSVIQSDFPIYINDEKKLIKNIYLKCDHEIQNLFDILPSEYTDGNDNNDLIKSIFNMKGSPSITDLIELIQSKKYTFDEIKNIIKYIHYKNENENINLELIPILKNNTIQYIHYTQVIWKNGKELGLVNLSQSYNDDFKMFFIRQVGIPEEPTLEQFVEHLTTNPKNHVEIFLKFIKLLSEYKNEIKSNIINKKIIKINNKMFSFDEIIFNDEMVSNAKHIENLFNVEKRYYELFKNIALVYNIKLLSSFDREYVIGDISENDEIIDIYLKLLNFVWDYSYSNGIKEFDILKKNEKFILETKNIVGSAYGKIILRINVDKQYIDIEEKLAIKDQFIYVSNKIDKRNIVKEISKLLVKQVRNLKFEILERFYDKVYKHKEFTIEEYYNEEKIQSPENSEDQFDNIFEQIKNSSDLFFEDSDSNQKIDENNDANIIDNENDKDRQSSEDNENQSYNSNDNERTKNNKKVSPKTNDLTVCPECNISIKVSNLDKHLLKVHHKNCDKKDEDISNSKFKNTNDVLNAANKHNKETSFSEEEISPDILSNPEEYAKKLKKTLEKNREETKNRTYRQYSSSPKIGKLDTRDFLYRQYKGYCQICGFTFDKKNNTGKYFELFDWFSEKISKQKVDIITPGSSLCLCSQCHSIIKHGDFKSKFVDNLKAFDLSKISFDDFCKAATNASQNIETPECYDFIEIDMYKIPIRILYAEKSIFYTEEHFLHLFSLVQLDNVE